MPSRLLAPTLVTLGLALAAPALRAQQVARAEAGAGSSGVHVHPGVGSVSIPGGRYTPFYVSGSDTAGITVAPFRIDVRPVTIGEYLEFLQSAPSWLRGEAAPALVGPDYLDAWAGPLDPGARSLDQPVTQVSWFAARAYCRASGGRLPTTDEWEYVAQASETRTNAFRDADFNRRTLALVQARTPADRLPPAGTTDRNAFGVRDMHGLVWEWTADFNNQMLTGAGRDDRGLDRGRFCAAGSVGTSDLTNYAAFLRWAFRTSLTGATAADLLGFRCAR